MWDRCTVIVKGQLKGVWRDLHLQVEFDADLLEECLDFTEGNQDEWLAGVRLGCEQVVPAQTC